MEVSLTLILALNLTLILTLTITLILTLTLILILTLCEVANLRFKDFYSKRSHGANLRSEGVNFRVYFM